MAAYAALVSLANNMKQIQNHPRLSTSFDSKQMKSLLQRIEFLLDFIESYTSYGGSEEEAEDLEMQIASAAHAAEDVIESHIVKEILTDSSEQGSSFLDLRKLMEEMDSIKEMVMKVKEERECKAELPYFPVSAASPTPLNSRKSNMVGFDSYLTQLLEELTGHQSDRKIITVVGMAGIGKTTLARNTYDNLLVVHHFDVRAWVTVSQGYNVRGILFETLSCLRLSDDGMNKKTEHDLGEQLYKTLSGMRYLIILDDMWSIEVWDEIKVFFPNNCNRSRILVTTRISDIANHFGSMGLALNFLDDDQSWNLFCEKVFPDAVCPPELEDSGKKIVKKCKGLPLAIVVIGGLLGRSSRTQDQWENVEKDVRLILNTAEDNRCSKLLTLSYSHLPACLKPCFLYLRIFPEDEVIRVSRLIKLWVAEGFIKQNNEKSLEEIAEGYIEDLVDRNLMSVDSLRCNGKFKACGIHDLVRELCISISEKEKFLCSTRVLGAPQERQRRIIIHGIMACYPQVIGTLKSKSLARSLISKGYMLHVKSSLLRVLIEVYGGLDDTFQQVNLRFLACESRRVLSTYHLPPSISLLWNVQTLIIKGVKEVVAPSQIWEMPQLRHLKFNYLTLPDPPPTPTPTPTDGFVLHNLQTLGRVVNFRCSKEASKRMPNIKKLRVFYDDFSRKGETWSYYCLHNFVFFDKLESLQYDFLLEPNRDDLLQSLVFPSSLNKLTLNNCELEWNDLTIVGSLSHLEVLKLKFFGDGFSWNPVEGEFLRLRYLKMERCKLNCWNADNTHFPVLENLVLEGMHDLNEIPSGIGDIHTLQRIYLVNCCFSVALSAIEILEEQESLGNQGLQVKVVFQDNWELEKFMEQVDPDILTSLNFQIEGV